MKKLLSKLTCLFMSAIILSVPLFSCAEKSDKDNPTKNETEVEGTQITNSGEPATEEIKSDLPEMSFNDSDFTVMIRAANYNEWANFDIYAESINGELINDAVFNRNARIEDKYKVKIKPLMSQEIQGDAMKSIKAGDNAFDAVAPQMGACVALQNNELLYNLIDLKYLDTTKPWWDQRINEAFEMHDKLFYSTGDISISASDATWIMMFNKEIHKELNMENLYDLVLTGKWTIDKFQDLLKDTYKDMNGDSTVDKSDMFGMATHEYSGTGFFYSAGNSIAAKNADGLINLSMNTQQTMDTMEKTVKIMSDNNVYSVPVGQWADVLDMFQNNRALFYGEVLQCVIRLRQMETNFGVLPYPKYDENQKEYYNFVANAATFYAVPKTTADPDKAGFMLEALAYESTKELTPAYIDKTLKGKHMRDEESTEMLKIILKSRKYDLGYMFDWGGLNAKYMSSVTNKSSDFASMYEKAEPKAISELDKFLKTYE